MSIGCRCLRAASLRGFMTVVILCGPLLAARAAEPLATDYLTQQSIAAVTIRPARMLDDPRVQHLPVEVAEAACQKYLGIASRSILRVTVIGEPPLGMQPYYAIVVDLGEPMSLEGLHDELLDALAKETSSTSLAGRTLLENRNPILPSLYMPNDRTLIAAPRGMLDKMLKLAAEASDSEGEPTPLARAMSVDGGNENELHGALMLKPIQPLIQLGMMGARQEVEPRYYKYLDAVGLINGLLFTADLSGERDSYLRVLANSPEDADRLDTLLDEGLAEIQEKVFNDPNGEFVQLATSGDPVQEALAQYMQRTHKQQVEAYRPVRQGDKGFTLAHIPAGAEMSPMYSMAVIGILVALLLPAVQAAREAARRNTSRFQLKQLNLALLNYHAAHASFPAQAISDDAGNPLLSWRVAVLPFLEELELYHRFHLDEPWDSPHNRELIPLMPELFSDPSCGLESSTGKTHYLGVAGPKAIFNGKPEGIRLRDMVDGSSKTLAMVQVTDEHAVTWTQPKDFDSETHKKEPMGGIGTIHPGGFLAAFCDGSVKFIELDVDPELFYAMTTRAGGEVVD